MSLFNHAEAPHHIGNLIFSILLLFGRPAVAEASTSMPILRIETGMHNAIIERIGIDAQGKLLVTGSRDKTIRVWDINQGTLSRTIRPPIGSGHQGKIFAVDISPDGTLIAAGGTTQVSQGGAYCIYIFDQMTGGLVQVIDQLPDILYNIKFSPDGTRLAAGLASGGLRVFQAADGRLLTSDSDYGDGLTGLDWDATGRLVTSCLDGQIRLYGRDHTRLRQLQTGADKPYSVRFSPDGSRVAVGYMNAARVTVLSTDGLQPLLPAPSVSGVGAEDLSAVSWSRDGERLCAGGRWLVADWAKLRCWSGRGLLRVQDVTAWTDAIYDLAALPDGKIIFASGEPAWGVLDRDGRRVRTLTGPGADFRDNLAGFWVDASGSRVRFGFQKHGQQPAIFSLTPTGFEAEGSASATLQPARTTAPALAITGWQGTPAVKVNGLGLSLSPHEEALSLAIATDATWFALGTGRFVRCYGRDGHERWSTAAPGETQAVNISGDGRLVVAAFSDGTIRWYSANSGAELLALYPHRDRSRWVLWTPAGYYQASPEGESLLGWHIPRGPRQSADFWPVGTLRAAYLQPDIIQRALSRDTPEPPPTPSRMRLRPVVATSHTALPGWRCVAVGMPIGLAATFVEVPVSLASVERLLPGLVPALQSLDIIRPCSDEKLAAPSPRP